MSNENNTLDTYLDYGPVVLGILTSLLSLVMLVAIFGNLLVIVTILRNRTMRTRTNLLLCNLALADILVGVFDVPIAIATLNYGKWVFGPTFCRFNAYMVGMGIMLSLHTLMYISIHKFFSIKNMFKAGLSLRTIYLMVAASWAWALFYNTLSILGWTQEKYKKGASQCGPVVPVTPLQVSHSVTNKLFNFIIPLCVITVFYYKIFALVKDHLSRLDGICDMKMTKSLIQQKKILKTLVIVLVCFVLCYTPYIIYSSCLVIRKEAGVYPIFNPLAYLAMYLNSACNPIIYALMFPKFRKGFKEIICGSKSKKDWAKYTYRPPPPVVRYSAQKPHVPKNLLSVPVVQNWQSKNSAQPNAWGENDSEDGRFGFLVSSFRQSIKKTKSHPELSLRSRYRQKRMSQPLNQKPNQNANLRRLNTAPPIRRPRTESLIAEHNRQLNNTIKNESIVDSLIPNQQRRLSTLSALTSVVQQENKMEDAHAPFLDEQIGVNRNIECLENGITHLRRQRSASVPNLLYGSFDFEEANYSIMDTLSPTISTTEINFIKAVSHDNIYYRRNLDNSRRASSQAKLEQATMNTADSLLREPPVHIRDRKGRLSLANIITSLKISFTDLFGASSIDEADEDPCEINNGNISLMNDQGGVPDSPSAVSEREASSRI